MDDFERFEAVVRENERMKIEGSEKKPDQHSYELTWDQNLKRIFYAMSLGTVMGITLWVVVGAYKYASSASSCEALAISQIDQ